MTIRPPFTPDVLLSAPRRSACVPNPSGTFVAYIQTTYSFESRSTLSELRLLNIASEKAVTVSNAIKGSPQWINDTQLVWLKDEKNENTSFMVVDTLGSNKPYTAGTVSGPVSDLKLTVLSHGAIGFAVAGKSNPDGSLYNPSNAETPVSSGKIYTSLFVRHWDEYIQSQKNAIWLGTLNLAAPPKNEYRVSELKNLFELFDLQDVESPIPPFGGADHFDICPQGVAFLSKDPTLNPATHTRCICYVCPMDSWAQSAAPLKANAIHLATLRGALASPVISPVHHTLAYLAMQEDGYESDKNRILIVPGLFGDSPEPIELFSNEEGTGGWNLNPSSLTWAHDDSSIFIGAEDSGRGAVFQLPTNDFATATQPDLRKLTSSGNVSNVASRPSGLFLSSSSLVESSEYSIIRSSNSGERAIISSSSKDGASFGLSASQVDEIWWKGAENHPVHAWVVKPSGFKSHEKYPLCFLVHGGPQGAWNDQWSTRWNPAIFAEQGYVVVAPNPTGSTGYGQAFTDAIQGSWGGRPYEDLVKCFEYIEQNLSYVDTDRAVALGASYGGFMMNWIQGHELGRKFKALVTHDGIFSTKFALATEELYFPIHDLKGTYWQSRDIWQKWDPSEFISEWQTPHLVIHNSRDYRLSLAEGLATFNALQLRGVDSAFLTFPDENHWVLKPENSLVWHRAVLNWINKHVGLPLWLDKDGNDGISQGPAGTTTKLPVT